jgi:hypothetical protein
MATPLALFFAVHLAEVDAVAGWECRLHSDVVADRRDDGPYRTGDADACAARLATLSPCSCGNDCLVRLRDCTPALAFCTRFGALHAADRRYTVELLLSPALSGAGQVGSRRAFALPFVGTVCRASFIAALEVSARFLDDRWAALRRGEIGKPSRAIGIASHRLPRAARAALAAFVDSVTASAGLSFSELRSRHSCQALYDLYRCFMARLNVQLAERLQPSLSVVSATSFRRYCHTVTGDDSGPVNVPVEA